MSTSTVPVPVLASMFEQLPPFANDSNKALARAVKEKEQRLNEVAQETAHHAERLSVMKDHLNSVKKELGNAQALLEAKNKEIETEDHLKQLSEREAGRMRGELRKLEERSEAAREKVNILRNNTFRAQEKVEMFRQQMNWNEDELEQWIAASQLKEEDSLALEKYSKEDEARIKELTLQIEKLTLQVSKKQEELQREVTETQAAQIELDKTAVEFRKMHKERLELVSQWEETVKLIKKREDSILKTQERLDADRDALRQKEDVVKERAAMVQAQENDNREVESAIAAADRSVAKLRHDLAGADKGLDSIVDEAEAMKAELQRITTEKTKARSEIEQLSKSIDEETQRIAEVELKKAAIKNKLADTATHTEEMERKIKELDELHHREEQRLTAMEKKINTLKDQTFKRSQELFRLRQTEANLIAEITGAQNAAKNLEAKIHKLDGEALKQQELIYNQEFQIQLLERRVARAQGERTQEEKIELNAKIEELTKVLDAATREFTTVAEQSKKLEIDLRAGKRRVTETERERETLTAKIDELTLDNDSASRSLKGLIKSKEELMVQQSVLKLEVKKLRALLNARADEVFTLENRKQQLALTMEEREREINVHRNMLMATTKSEEEDRHQAVMELKQRQTKIDKLQKKYEILLAKMGRVEDGEERSQAYYIIKAAQDKEELQRVGDELEAKMRKTCKEIRAMENTLSVLNVNNEAYHNQFRKAELDDEQFQQKKMLEDQVRAGTEKNRGKRRELRELKEELAALKQSFTQLCEEKQHLSSHVATLRTKRDQVESEISEFSSKLDRAIRAGFRVTRDLRRERGLADHEEAPEEREFTLSEFKEFNKRLNVSLREFAHAFPDLSSDVEKLFKRYSLATGSASQLSAVLAESRPSSASSGSSKGSRASRASDASRSSVRSAISRTKPLQIHGTAPAP